MTMSAGLSSRISWSNCGSVQFTSRRRHIYRCSRVLFIHSNWCEWQNDIRHWRCAWYWSCLYNDIEHSLSKV